METVNHSPRKKESDQVLAPVASRRSIADIRAESRQSLDLPPPPSPSEINRIQSGSEGAAAIIYTDTSVMMPRADKNTNKGGSTLKNTDDPIEVTSNDTKKNEKKEKIVRNATSASFATVSEDRREQKDRKSNRSTNRKTVLEENGIILGKVIGAGTYAKVKIAYLEKMKSPVAIKIISKTKAPKEYTEKFLPREIESVKGLHHENLIQFYQSIETNHKVYLVMQLAENGTLLDFIRAKSYLEEETSRKLMKQLISAVNYCHSKGVVHRDIKCENILLDSHYNLKLIDFGFARKGMLTTDDKAILSKTFCGSYAYASPEILKAIPYDPFKSDIWASGVVFYAMVFGRLPYDGPNLNELLKRVTAKLIFPKSPTVSNSCKHLIVHILAPLKVRYRIVDIQMHPWFTGKE